MIQISVKSRKNEVFLKFSRCLASTRSIGKFNFIKIAWLQMTEKWPKKSIKS